MDKHRLLTPAFFCLPFRIDQVRIDIDPFGTLIRLRPEKDGTIGRIAKAGRPLHHGAEVITLFWDLSDPAVTEDEVAMKLHLPMDITFGDQAGPLKPVTKVGPSVTVGSYATSGIASKGS